uniref:Uncharacterized protein n=1 Tax=Plectus sambesii TaxID=2011161 RepID=A0A914UK21_9BILA
MIAPKNTGGGDDVLVAFGNSSSHVASTENVLEAQVTLIWILCILGMVALLLSATVLCGKCSKNSYFPHLKGSSSTQTKQNRTNARDWDYINIAYVHQERYP